ncbi:hypothetical protein Tco_0491081 [Tanacetum coccineum]
MAMVSKLPKGYGCLECGATWHFSREIALTKKYRWRKWNSQGWVFCSWECRKETKHIRKPQIAMSHGTEKEQRRTSKAIWNCLRKGKQLLCYVFKMLVLDPKEAQIEAQKPENLVNEDVGGMIRRDIPKERLEPRADGTLCFTPGQELVTLLWRLKTRDYARIPQVEIF